MILLPTVENKLMARWDGPYVVKKRVTPVTYQIDRNDRKNATVFSM